MPASTPQVLNGTDCSARLPESPSQSSFRPASQNGGPDPSPRNRRQSTTSQFQDNPAPVVTDCQNGSSISSGNSQHKKSARSWSSGLPSTKVVMTIVGFLFTILFGAPVFVYSTRAEKSAEQANQAAAEGNRLAALGNRLTIWQLCNSEEEYRNTTLCADVMKNGPFLPEKRIAPRRMPAREFQYPNDFKRFTRHHGLLVHLLAHRIQLGQELHAFHKNSEDQQSLSKGSPSTEICEQFKRITNSISVSESHILSLLSLMHSSEEVGETPPLDTDKEENIDISHSESAKAWPTLESKRHHRTQTALEFNPKPLGARSLERQDRNYYVTFLSSNPWITLLSLKIWYRYCGRRLARSERLGHVVYTCFSGLWISAITYMFFFSTTWVAFVALYMLELIWRGPFFRFEHVTMGKSFLPF